jgi:hypothetical protein
VPYIVSFVRDGMTIATRESVVRVLQTRRTQIAKRQTLVETRHVASFMIINNGGMS